MKSKTQSTDYSPRQYNPLLDKYLNDYFERRGMLSILQKNKIVNKQGDILDFHLRKEYKQLSQCGIRQTSLPLQSLLQKIKMRQFSHSRGIKKEFAKTEIDTSKSILERSQFNIHLCQTYLKKPDILRKREKKSFSVYR